MNPSSRMNYDLGGASMGAQNVNADEVLDEVLRKIYEVWGGCWVLGGMA